MSAKLDLNELIRANERLKDALAQPKNDYLRDSVIQRFEFTVELSWKSLGKALQILGLTGGLAPKSIVREGASLGLVAKPDRWLKFIDDRNRTSHSYRESVAEEVYATAKEVPLEVDDLIAKLRTVITE